MSDIIYNRVLKNQVKHGGEPVILGNVQTPQQIITKQTTYKIPREWASGVGECMADEEMVSGVCVKKTEKLASQCDPFVNKVRIVAEINGKIDILSGELNFLKQLSTSIGNTDTTSATNLKAKIAQHREKFSAIAQAQITDINDITLQTRELRLLCQNMEDKLVSAYRELQALTDESNKFELDIISIHTDTLNKENDRIANITAKITTGTEWVNKKITEMAGTNTKNSLEYKELVEKMNAQYAATQQQLKLDKEAAQKRIEEISKSLADAEENQKAQQKLLEQEFARIEEDKQQQELELEELQAKMLQEEQLRKAAAEAAQIELAKQRAVIKARAEQQAKTRGAQIKQALAQQQQTLQQSNVKTAELKQAGVDLGGITSRSSIISAQYVSSGGGKRKI